MQVSRSAFVFAAATGILASSFLPVFTMAARSRTTRSPTHPRSRSTHTPIAPTTTTTTTTTRPVKPPTPKPTVNADAAAGQALTQARVAIVKLIQGDNTLVPQFLRMGFHDCVGGCDGKNFIVVAF